MTLKGRPASSSSAPPRLRLLRSHQRRLRITRRPHFLGIQSHHQLHTHPRYGASWEGFALEQILTKFGSRNAYFYATQNGAELDLFLTHQGKRYGFEFKCTDAPKTTKSMHTTSADLKLDHLYVVYPGQKQNPLNEKMTALPLIDLPEFDLS